MNFIEFSIKEIVDKLGIQNFGIKQLKIFKIMNKNGEFSCNLLGFMNK